MRRCPSVVREDHSQRRRDGGGAACRAASRRRAGAAAAAGSIFRRIGSSSPHAWSCRTGLWTGRLARDLGLDKLASMRRPTASQRLASSNVVSAVLHCVLVSSPLAPYEFSVGARIDATTKLGLISVCLYHSPFAACLRGLASTPRP